MATDHALNPKNSWMVFQMIRCGNQLRLTKRYKPLSSVNLYGLVFGFALRTCISESDIYAPFMKPPTAKHKMHV
jgi:hypothetical protein